MPLRREISLLSSVISAFEPSSRIRHATSGGSAIA
jgi:hypothetical protein